MTSDGNPVLSSSDSSGSGSTSQLEAIVEEVLERHRQGEKPNVEEYITRYPALEREIRDTLPALALLEDCGLGSANQTEGYCERIPDSRPVEQIGDYRLLEEIGRGGMGVVYAAEQLSLGRRVALKLLPSHVPMDSHRFARFQREAQVTAQLHHTNIVPVYEVGHEGEFTFYAMQLIEGPSLDQILEEQCQPSNSLPSPILPSEECVRVAEHKVRSAFSITIEADFRWVANVGLQLAEALAYAHVRGIIHRDVKPSNLILDSAGVVWLTDFGLAKTEEEGLTSTGDVLGTLRYMSPERFQGECNASTDIYAMGLVLYELLTNRPAFLDSVRARLIRAIVEKDPPRPRSIDPKIPLDLETICLKCIEKDSTRRYGTSDEVAADLRRFVNGEPISIRPVGLFAQTWRWMQRYPTRAALIVAIGIALLAVAGIIVGLGYQSRLTATNEELGVSLHRERSLSKELRHARDSEAQARDTLDRLLYFRRVSLALSEWEKGEVVYARALLKACPAKRRYWEWHHLDALFHPEERIFQGHKQKITALAFSPDGRQLVSASRDGTIRLQDPKTGAESHTLKNGSKEILDIAVGSDGNQLFSCSTGGTITDYNLSIGRLTRTIDTSGTPVSSVAVSTDGHYLASGSSKRLTLWDRKSGQHLLTKQAHKSGVTSVSFSPDSRRLVTSSYDKSVRLWEIPSGKLLHTWKGLSIVSRAVFSPDGKTIAVAVRDPDLILLDPLSGREKATLSGHTGAVYDVAFHADGTQLASVGEDATVRLWDVANAKLLQTWKGHVGEVTAVAFSPDGKLVASGGEDHTVRTWRTQSTAPVEILEEHAGRIRGMTRSPNGKWFAYGVGDTAVVRELGSLKKVQELLGLSGEVRCLCFSPSSDLLAVGGVQGIELWNMHTSERMYRLKHSVLEVSSLAFSPDGQRLASTIHHTLCTWNVATGKAEWSVVAHHPMASGVAFVENGKCMVSSGYDNQLRVWDATTGKPLKALAGHTDVVLRFAISPSGRWLTSAGGDGKILWWDTRTWNCVRTTSAHTGGVIGIAYTPDEQRLFSAGSDSRIRLWDVETGELVVAFEGQPTPIGSFCLTRDGKRLIQADVHKRIHFWKAPGFSTKSDPGK